MKSRPSIRARCTMPTESNSPAALLLVERLTSGEMQ